MIDIIFDITLAMAIFLLVGIPVAKMLEKAKKEMEEDFKNIVGNRVSKYIDIDYAFQETDSLPVRLILSANPDEYVRAAKADRGASPKARIYNFINRILYQFKSHQKDYSRNYKT